MTERRFRAVAFQDRAEEAAETKLLGETLDGERAAVGVAYRDVFTFGLPPALALAKWLKLYVRSYK